jgi:hypothetical protein
MDFVGRKQEITAIRRSLTAGHNVILTGRFGVGRSRLVKHFSKLCAPRWRLLFADFSRPAARFCNDMLRQLVPHRGSSAKNRYIRLIHAKDLLWGKEAQEELQRVIVLDNMGKISNQKLDFIRGMRFDSKVMFIAITESFLPESDLFRLRSALYPSRMLILGNLSKTETLSFFRLTSERKNLGWNDSFIRMLAASTDGYPLLMRERLQREMQEKDYV